MERIAPVPRRAAGVPGSIGDESNWGMSRRFGAALPPARVR